MFLQNQFLKSSKQFGADSHSGSITMEYHAHFVLVIHVLGHHSHQF